MSLFTYANVGRGAITAVYADRSPIPLCASSVRAGFLTLVVFEVCDTDRNRLFLFLVHDPIADKPPEPVSVDQSMGLDGGEFHGHLRETGTLLR